MQLSKWNTTQLPIFIIKKCMQKTYIYIFPSFACLPYRKKVFFKLHRWKPYQFFIYLSQYIMQSLICHAFPSLSKPKLGHGRHIGSSLPIYGTFLFCFLSTIIHFFTSCLHWIFGYWAHIIDVTSLIWSQMGSH